LAEPHQSDATKVQAFDEIGCELQGLAEKMLRRHEIPVFEADPPEGLQGFETPWAGEQLTIEMRCLRTVPPRVKLPRIAKDLVIRS
jgi:hypothetical protein